MEKSVVLFLSRLKTNYCSFSLICLPVVADILAAKAQSPVQGRQEQKAPLGWLCFSKERLLAEVLLRPAPCSALRRGLLSGQENWIALSSAAGA